MHLNSSPALLRSSLYSLRGFGWQWLNVPDHIGVFLNASVAAEESHPADAGNAFADPFILVLVCLIDECVCFDVAVEIVADEIIVAMIDNGVAKGREVASVAEHTSPDGIKYLLQIFVQLEVAVIVCMSEVFHVFC